MIDEEDKLDFIYKKLPELTKMPLLSYVMNNNKKKLLQNYINFMDDPNLYIIIIQLNYINYSNDNIKTRQYIKNCKHKALKNLSENSSDQSSLLAINSIARYYGIIQNFKNQKNII